jgi:transcription initiation factor TFIIF subunit beta
MSSANAKGTTGVTVTAESYGALDASQVANEVWMVRIPPRLGQIWNEAAEGTVLGELVFTKGGTVNGDQKKATLEVHISEETLTEEHSDLPLEYTMEAMTQRVPVLHPFTRNPDGSVVLHGTVSRTANLQMSPSDERYRKLCKNRILQTNITSTRFVKTVQANELSVRKSHSAAVTSSSSKGFGSAVQQFGRKIMEQNDDGGEGGEQEVSGKKRKYQGQPTQSVVFELFSAQPFWSVKEMRQASGRPEKEIRQVLGEIAEFLRGGEHKGMWQLRKEFQKQET